MSRFRQGSSLLEVLISFAVILLAALYLMSTLASGRHHAQRAQQYSTASLLANGKIQQLLTLPIDDIQPGSGAFPSPHEGYVYSVDVVPFEGTIQVLQLEVRSPRGALAFARTLVQDPRFFGVTVEPVTNEVAFSPAGQPRIGFVQEPANTVTFSPDTPDGRPIHGLAAKPGWNLVWTSAIAQGLQAFTQISPASSWRPAVANPATPLKPLFTGLASDTYSSQLFAGDAANKAIWISRPAWTGPIRATNPPLGAPGGVACDAFGTLVWVADRDHQCLRKLLLQPAPGYSAAELEACPEGFWHRTEFRPTEVWIGSPQGVAVDPSGWAVYVVDGGRLYRFIDSSNEWSVLATLPAVVAQAGPSGLALDSTNNVLYINCSKGKLVKFKLSDSSFTELWSR